MTAARPGGATGARDLAIDLVVEQLRRQVPGGIGTYCRGLVLGLTAMPPSERPAVTLRASRAWRTGGGPDPLAALGLPLEASLLPAPLLTRVWDAGIPLGWSRSPGQGPAKAPAVVHGTSFATPPVRNQPVVAMVHDLAWRRFPDAYPERGRSWHEAALVRLARVACAFVVPSALTAADLVGAGLGVREGQVHVIDEGVDHLGPPDGEAADALLASKGVPPGEGFLLTVGTLEPRKNLPRLIEAYGRARRQLPEAWPLVVVGPKGWADGGRAVAEPPDGVVAIGPVAGSVLQALYERARCVAYVPIFEGFGLPAGEAMRAGAPVVASIGLPSVGDAGMQVDPTDPAAIAAALVAASTDSAERLALISAGSRRVADLTWERCARAHVALWEGVAGS